MAEKFEIVGSVVIDSSGAKVGIDKINKALKDAETNLEQVKKSFGEGSAEAKKAADEVAKLNSTLKQAKDSGAGIEQPIKNWKSQLRDAKTELQLTIDKFGELSPEVAVAAQRVAELEDKIGDAKKLTDAFNPDAKFKGLSNAIQGATGALTAITGAQALFGSESKAVQETLVKVQGAMAFSQGINSILESKDAFKALYAQITAVLTVKKADVVATEAQIAAEEGLVVAQEAATAASKVLKGALIATGIGALLVAVGTLIAYWDKIKGAVTGVSKEQEKQNALSKKNVEYANKAYKIIEGSTEQYKLQGKSEKEILQLKVKGIDAAIKAQEIAIITAENTKKAQVEAAKRNFEITKFLVGSITAPIQVILASIDLIGKAVGKDFGLRAGFTEGIAKMMFDPEEVAKEGDKTIQEQKDTLLQLKEQQAGFKNQINEIDKQAADEAAKKRKEAADKAEEERKKQEEKEKEERKKRLEEYKNFGDRQTEIDDLVQQNRINSIKDANEKRDAQVESDFQKEIDALLKQNDDKLLTEEQFKQKREALDEKYRLIREANNEADALKKFNTDIANLEKDINNSDLAFHTRQSALDKEQEQLQLALDNKTISQKEYDDKYAASVEKRKAIDKAELEYKLQYAAKFGSILSQLGDVLGKNTKAGKKAAIAGLLIDQGLNVAKITMDTIASTKAIAKKYSGIPGGQIPAAIEIGLNIAQGALSVAKSVQAVKKGIADINAAGGGESGGGGGAAGGGDMNTGAPIPPQATQTALPQDQINQLASANAATRAYVIESDVTNNQERITRINRAARIS